MCGITGFWNLDRSDNTEQAQAIVEGMNRTLIHRGPDDGGIWVDPAVGIALANRRLAIIDLSQEGHQPMHSSCGRFVLVLNGEIYNFAILRNRLEAGDNPPRFRGHSDTEVLVEAISRWGIMQTLQDTVGMFALAVWDRAEQTLVLGRDRIGEKPLYWGYAGNCLIFGSELKALRAHPLWRSEIDPGALSLYLRHGYVPGPYSIYMGINKLAPGTLRYFTADGGQHEEIYWSARNAVEQGNVQPFVGSKEDAVDQMGALLREAVVGQMIADVPLGAFLSGGIDSSTIVALMQAQSMRAVKTFSIGFREDTHDEAVYARAVARHLGTDHTELYVTPQDAIEVIPTLPNVYDEPFADSSQIPTVLVARLAQKHVKVSLSGDGGDELFAGYRAYANGVRLWHKLSRIPGPLRRTTGAVIGQLTSVKDIAYSGDAQLGKLAKILASSSYATYYQTLMSLEANPSRLLSYSIREPSTAFTAGVDWLPHDSLWQRMMYLDMVTYLPGDILVKVDRAAMSTSLESRVPLLDHRVIEFAWRLPIELKWNAGKSKWLLRQILDQYVPQELIDRPKMGFGVPIGAWLRGPLRAWAENLLSLSNLNQSGPFNPAPIRSRWQEHLAGKYDWQDSLWTILMFQAWLQSEEQPY